tara:strand:+ start:325 stop:555 length:231 start_codon:yes stop_codon:yes gene_type:complete
MNDLKYGKVAVELDIIDAICSFCGYDEGLYPSQPFVERYLRITGNQHNPGWTFDRGKLVDIPLAELHELWEKLGKK